MAVGSPCVTPSLLSMIRGVWGAVPWDPDEELWVMCVISVDCAQLVVTFREGVS